MCGSFIATTTPTRRRPAGSVASSDDDVDSPWTRTSDQFGSHYQSRRNLVASTSPVAMPSFGTPLRPGPRAVEAPVNAMTPPPHSDVLGHVDMSRERSRGNLGMAREPRRAAPPRDTPAAAGHDALARVRGTGSTPSAQSPAAAALPAARHRRPVAPSIPLGVHDYAREEVPEPGLGRRGGGPQRALWPSHPLPPTPPKRFAPQPPPADGHGPPGTMAFVPGPAYADRHARLAAAATHEERLQDEYRLQREAAVAHAEAAQRQQLAQAAQHQLHFDPNAYDNQFQRLYRDRHTGSDTAALLTFPG